MLGIPDEIVVQDVLIVTAEAQEPRELAGPRGIFPTFGEHHGGGGRSVSVYMDIWYEYLYLYV